MDATRPEKCRCGKPAMRYVSLRRTSAEAQSDAIPLCKDHWDGFVKALGIAEPDVPQGPHVVLDAR